MWFPWHFVSTGCPFSASTSDPLNGWLTSPLKIWHWRLTGNRLCKSFWLVAGENHVCCELFTSTITGYKQCSPALGWCSPRSVFIPAKYSSASKQRIRNIYHHSLLAYYTVFQPGHIIVLKEHKHMSFKPFSKTFKVIAYCPTEGRSKSVPSSTWTDS